MPPKTKPTPSTRKTSAVGSAPPCSADCFPLCSGDPSDCPENDGYGCGKPNPEMLCRKCGGVMGPAIVLAPNVVYVIESKGANYQHVTEGCGSVKWCIKCPDCGHSFLPNVKLNHHTPE